MKKNVLIWSGILVGTLIVGVSLLVISALVPNEPVRNHTLESAPIFAMPNDLLSFRNDNRYSVQDHFTDALMAEEAMMIDRDKPFQSVMRCDFPFTGDPIGDLNKIANGEGADLPVRDYARYWHGYLFWLRPMLALASWNTIRKVTLVMLSLVLLLCISLWSQKKGIAYAMGSCFPILLCCFPQAGISPQLSSVYFVGLIASIVLLSVPHICEDIRWSGGVMLIAGCATSYIDLLTAPMIGLLLPLLTYCMLAKREKGFYKNVALLLGICFVGYFGFWFMKWVIGTVVTDLNVIESGFHNAHVRSYGCDDDFYTWTTIFERIGEFLCEPFIYVPILVAGLIWICLIKPKQIVPNLYLLILAIVPIVWMFVMRQHSAYHFYHLSWRNMIPCFVAVLLFMIETSRLTDINAVYSRGKHPAAAE
ncbi:MAG: hypothetical protein MJZ64_03720 [Paludibacteraceae bacterium]|nr:hypothetical protein [Paludibacteraceae bacterium]